MKVINKINCADSLNKEQEAITIESIHQQNWEEKAVKITIDSGDAGIKISVNVLASEVINAVKNAINC